MGRYMISIRSRVGEKERVKSGKEKQSFSPTVKDTQLDGLNDIQAEYRPAISRKDVVVIPLLAATYITCR